MTFNFADRNIHGWPARLGYSPWQTFPGNCPDSYKSNAFCWGAEALICWRRSWHEIKKDHKISSQIAGAAFLQTRTTLHKRSTFCLNTVSCWRTRTFCVRRRIHIRGFSISAAGVGTVPTFTSLWTWRYWESLDNKSRIIDTSLVRKRQVVAAVRLHSQ